LLNNLDTRVTSLPGLLRSTDGFEERKEGRDTEGGSDDRERASGGVSNVLIGVINIYTTKREGDISSRFSAMRSSGRGTHQDA
jgi:hypothetical protein